MEQIKSEDQTQTRIDLFDTPNISQNINQEPLDNDQDFLNDSKATVEFKNYYLTNENYELENQDIENKSLTKNKRSTVKEVHCGFQTCIENVFRNQFHKNCQDNEESDEVLEVQDSLTSSEIKVTSTTFLCTYCNYETNVEEEINEHISTHETVLCKTSSNETNSKLDLVLHEKTCEPKKIENSFNCSNEERASKKEKIDEKGESEVDMIRNEDISGRFDTERCEEDQFGVEIEISANSEQTKEMYRCKQCSYQCTAIRSIKRHMNGLSKELLKCDQCSYTSTICSDYVDHRRCHEKECYSCNQCSYTTDMLTSIESHVSLHLKNEKLTKHKCDQCSYEHQSLKRLNQHKKVHLRSDNVKLFACDSCSFISIYQSSLFNHIKAIHEGKTVPTVMLQCDKCDFQITKKKKREWLEHRLMHLKNNERRELLMCHMCEFYTLKSSSLKLHVRAHIGSRKLGLVSYRYGKS